MMQVPIFASNGLCSVGCIVDALPIVEATPQRRHAQRLASQTIIEAQMKRTIGQDTKTLVQTDLHSQSSEVLTRCSQNGSQHSLCLGECAGAVAKTC